MSERSRKIILAISLALNVFIVGAAAGGAYMFYANGRPMIGKGGLLVAASRLSAEQRKVLRQMLVQARQDSSADLEAARTARGEAARLLEQDPLDRPAIDAQLATIRAADSALRGRLEQAVIDFAETLKPQERQRLVDGLQRNGAMLRRLSDRKN